MPVVASLGHSPSGFDRLVSSANCEFMRSDLADKVSPDFAYAFEQCRLVGAPLQQD
jgi:hypothetical protein